MRPGAALPMVLLSLGLVAALSVGGAFVTRRMATDASLTQRSLELAPMVEEGIVRAAAGMDTATLWAIPIGHTAELVTGSGGTPGSAATEVWISRLGDRDFQLVGEASTSAKPLLHIRLGLFVRLDSTGLRPAPSRPWSRLP